MSRTKGGDQIGEEESKLGACGSLVCESEDASEYESTNYDLVATQPIGVLTVTKESELLFMTNSVILL